MISILITSGGTTVPLDPVRNIGNNSTGHFGATLAIAALQAGMRVNYLAAQQAQSPFATCVNFYAESDAATAFTSLQAQHEFFLKYRAQYAEQRFVTYADYASKLQQLILQQKPDIVILAAAVSDYVVANPSAEKIQSSEALNIQLQPAAKIIQQVKQWLPETFLVGCKLLVNASDEALLAAAYHSIAKNNLDLCIANDLQSVKRHAHEIILVRKDKSSQKITTKLADAVMAECLLQVRK